MVTAKAAFYPSAIRTCAPDAKHTATGFYNLVISTNRCERNHGYVKARIRPTRGLKSFACAKRLFPGRHRRDDLACSGTRSARSAVFSHSECPITRVQSKPPQDAAGSQKCSRSARAAGAAVDPLKKVFSSGNVTAAICWSWLRRRVISFWSLARSPATCARTAPGSIGHRASPDSTHYRPRRGRGHGHDPDR